MRILWIVFAGLALFYPLLVYWGLQNFEPKIIGLGVLFFYLLRSLLLAKARSAQILLLAMTALAAVLVWLLNSEALLEIVPAIISLIFFGVFLHSLLQPPTLPAKFAKRVHGELSPQLLRYTNAVTVYWMGFFLLNASISLSTVFFFSNEVWTLYNGLLSYIFIGLVFAAEYAYRRLVFNRKRV